MHSLISELQAAGQDFEFYPTTEEILKALVRDLKRWTDKNYRRDLNSVLDIGAGNGKALAYLKRAGCGFQELFAIEKSAILTNELDPEILVIGTEFREQSLISKQVGIIFCNPPYSEFEEWTVKIIREGAAALIYLVIPERWEDKTTIKDALKFRGAKCKVVGDFDFLASEDRAARAKVQLLRVELAEEKEDAFDRFFEEQFAPLVEKFKVTKDLPSCGKCGGIVDKDGYCESCHEYEGKPKGGRKRPFHGLIPGAGYPAALSGLYNVEMANVQKNYQLVGELDVELLREFEISPPKILKLLKQRLSGLRMEYWQELFGRMSPITDRLTSQSRRNLLDTLNRHTQVDFTESNILAVIVWALKNANRYINSQLLSTYELMVEKCNVENYKSNQRVFVDRGWRYEKESKENSHYKLDYRIVMHRAGGLGTGSYSHNHQNGLEERAWHFMRDLHTIASNLGFSARPPFDLQYNGPDWRSNESHTFYWHNREGARRELFEAKAFKNGNLHLRLAKEFILALNVEHGRLKGWLDSPETAAEELKDADAPKYFRSNHQLLSGSPTLHLGNGKEAAA